MAESQGVNRQDSILESIKKDLGLASSYEVFDLDVIQAINTAFSVLTQLGAGPQEGFRIQDYSSTWHDYFGENQNLELIKTYVFNKSKLIFDPPANSSILESLKQVTAELEWRIMMIFEHGGDENG